MTIRHSYSTMVKLFASILWLCLMALHCDASDADTDYYWKDYYKGQVPIDAIPGGFDKQGKPTYIGGVVHPNGKGFLPANLYPGSYAITQAGLTDSSNQVHTHTEYVKVLCSKHHKRYKWVMTNIEDIYKVNGTLVRGGKEWNWELYLGRATYMDEMKVGRVFRPQDQYKGLWLPDTVASGKFKNFNDFEILVYKEPCALCWNS